MPFIGNKPSNNFVSLKRQDITGDGTASYTLDYKVASVNDILVYVNHVKQDPSSMTVSGTSLTMGGNVASTDDFYVIFLGQALQTVTPADNTVTLDMLTASGTKSSSTFLRGDNTFQTIETNTPTFLAKLSADQTVTNATLTKVQFNSEVYDPQSTYDHSTNYRFTPGVAGKYFIFSQTDFEGTDITANWIRIYKNGSQIWGSHHDASGHSFTTQYMGVIDEANTTDYYEIYIYLDTTGTPKVKANFGSGLDVSFFGAYKIIE